MSCTRSFSIEGIETLTPLDETGLIGPTLSPDGLHAAVHRTVDGNTDVWVIDANRSVRFTTHPAVDQFSVWSPDGKWILFDSNRTGVRNIYRKASDGSGREERLWESAEAVSANAWSPDERFITFTIFPITGPGRIGLFATDSKKLTSWTTSEFDARGSQISPDGRWLAYQSNESGRYDIFVQPFPGPGGKWQVSTAGGVQVRWSRDGKELYYIGPDGTLMSVPVTVSGSTLSPGAAVPLFHTRIWGGGSNATSRQQYDVAPDGRFLVNVTGDAETAAPITLILNWQPK